MSQAGQQGPVASHNGNNIFLYDQTNDTTTLVSHAVSRSAAAGNNNSIQPVISSDGNFVAFTSYATDLVAGQNASSSSNVFRYSVADRDVILVSGRNGSPSVSGSGNSDSPVLSVDGSFVAFRSDAPDLIAGEGGPLGSNIFLFSGNASTPLTLVSHAASSPATRATGGSTNPVISEDGQLVAYLSTAGNLVPGQVGSGVNNVFGWDRSSGLNFLTSGTQGSSTAASSAAAFNPLISRDPVILFSVVGSLVQDQQGITLMPIR